MTFELKPDTGWQNFPYHEELIDFLLSTFNNQLRYLGWSYMNFTIDTSIFEDSDSNSIYIECYSPTNIAKIVVGLDNNSKSDTFNASTLSEDLKSRYNLKICPV